MTVILTVEDEFLVSEYLGHLLTSAGYEVFAASNADDAIDILEKRNDIRLVITDVNMPGSMDGLKLAAAVRGRWPPIKIIVASGMGIPRAKEMRALPGRAARPYHCRRHAATALGGTAGRRQH